jgi:hypothetical protein
MFWDVNLPKKVVSKGDRYFRQGPLLSICYAKTKAEDHLFHLCSSSTFMYLGGCSGDDAPIDRCNEAGVTLNRNFFCQFAENLGRGLYDGIWVGPDSPIPNMCEIRNDVVAAASVEGAKYLLGGGVLRGSASLAQRHRPWG